MKTRIFALGLAVLLVFTMLAGCSGGNSGAGSDSSTGSSQPAPAQQEYPITVNDGEIKEAPTSVVTLSPSLADVMTALKYETLLTGRSEDCTAEDLASLPTVGTAKNLDMDKLKELKPQLVLTEEALSESQVKELSDAGITVLVQTPATTRETFETLYTNIGSALKGGITGFTEAQEKAQNMLMTLDDINRLIPASNTPITACYLYDTTGAVVTGDTFASELMEFAGAVNVAGSSKNGKMELSALTTSNPNYIFCSSEVKEKLSNDETLSKLKAVQDGKVIVMEPELMDLQGSTIIEAVTLMAGAMYPELTSSSSETSSEASSEPASSEPSSSSSEAASSTPSSSSSEAASSGNSSNPFPKGTTMKLGDTGDNVTKLQQRLLELGHTYSEPTGTFDELTEQGVMNFQFLSDMVADGIADDALLDALYAPDAVKGPNYGLR